MCQKHLGDPAARCRMSRADQGNRGLTCLAGADNCQWQATGKCTENSTVRYFWGCNNWPLVQMRGLIGAELDLQIYVVIFFLRRQPQMVMSCLKGLAPTGLLATCVDSSRASIPSVSSDTRRLTDDEVNDLNHDLYS